MRFTLLFLFAFASLFAKAQDYISFGFNGNVLRTNDAVKQKNGKLAVAGDIMQNGRRMLMVVRFFTNGLPDSSFGSKGLFTYAIDESSNFAEAIQYLPDGNFLVSGSNYKNYSFTRYVIKVTTKGTIDSSFGNRGILLFAESYWNGLPKLRMQKDGKLLFAGTAYNANDNDGFLFQRYLKNGMADSSFGEAGTFKYRIEKENKTEKFYLGDITSDSAGRWVACGMRFASDPKTYYAIYRKTVVARYLPNWKPDQAFGNGTGYVVLPTEGIPSTEKIITTPDKKMFIFRIGYGPKPNEYRTLQLVKLNEDGSWDNSFSPANEPFNFSIDNQSFILCDARLTKKGELLLPTVYKMPFTMSGGKKKYPQKIMLITLNTKKSAAELAKEIKLGFSADTYQGSGETVRFLNDTTFLLTRVDPLEVYNYVEQLKTSRFAPKTGADIEYAADANGTSCRVTLGSSGNASPNATVASTKPAPEAGSAEDRAEEKKFKEMTRVVVEKVKKLKKAFDDMDKYSYMSSVACMDAIKAFAIAASEYDSWMRSSGYTASAYPARKHWVKEYFKWENFFNNEAKLRADLKAFLVKLDEGTAYAYKMLKQNDKPASFSNKLESTDYYFGKRLREFLELYEFYY
ncbi:MAG: hypothetical protein U0V75_16280 [Ferruginibacter sp.]